MFLCLTELMLTPLSQLASLEEPLQFSMWSGAFRTVMILSLSGLLGGVILSYYLAERRNEKHCECAHICCL